MRPNSSKPHAALKYRQIGFSLVELLVSLGLSMLVVIATTYVYLGTRETQRTLFEKAYANETAHFALDVIGRDIENAGFYPSSAISAGVATGGANTVRTYINPGTTPTGVTPATAGPAALNAAVFGCQGKRYQPTTHSCVSNPTGVDADTLVVNYYTEDAAGLDAGTRADCLRQDPANDVAFNGTNMVFSVGAAALPRRNSAHAATASADRPFLRPNSPLFVSNRYTLNRSSSDVQQIEDVNITVFSLACSGNGEGAASILYYPVIAGLEQLRFFFLERAGVASADSQFKRADSVTKWADVVAVRVCLVARSLQAARLQGSASFTISDCDGASRSYTDGIERRVFSQTVALKNHLQISNP